MRTYYIVGNKVSERKPTGEYRKVRTANRTMVATLQTFEKQHCNSTFGMALLKAFGTEKLYAAKLSEEYSKANETR